MPDVVVVKNLSDKPFRGKYNSRPFVIPANGDALLETEAAVIWFGNWQARNVGNLPANQFRAQEYERLRGLYGSHYDDRPQDEGWVIDKALKADEKWEQNRPRVEIYEQDDHGNTKRVVGVLEDPEGTELPLEETPSVDLAGVVAEQQRQIDQMQAALDSLKSQTSGAPVDSPNRVKRNRGAITPEPAREETADTR